MFGFFKSACTLEKELREWFIEDSVRILGESERQQCAEHATGKDVRYLVEDIASNLLNEFRDRDAQSRIFGIQLSRHDRAHFDRGRRLLQNFVNSKGWRLERDSEGRYIIKN